MAVDHADLSVKLMLRVKEGEKDAFSLLYDEHHRRILNFFYRLARIRNWPRISGKRLF